jgi:hypothetical protein
LHINLLLFLLLRLLFMFLRPLLLFLLRLILFLLRLLLVLLLRLLLILCRLSLLYLRTKVSHSLLMYMYLRALITGRPKSQKAMNSCGTRASGGRAND